MLSSTRDASPTYCRSAAYQRGRAAVRGAIFHVRCCIRLRNAGPRWTSLSLDRMGSGTTPGALEPRAAVPGSYFSVVICRDDPKGATFNSLVLAVALGVSAIILNWKALIGESYYQPITGADIASIVLIVAFVLAFKGWQAYRQHPRPRATQPAPASFDTTRGCLVATLFRLKSRGAGHATV
jgi:hypothetical protein